MNQNQEKRLKHILYLTIITRIAKSVPLLFAKVKRRVLYQKN